jgi:hypothetical protein
MLVVLLGALFVLGGLTFIVAQPILGGRLSDARIIWRGRLSDARRRQTSSAIPRDTLEPHTLEPRQPGAGFSLKANWPGLVLIVVGGILLLAGSGYYYGGPADNEVLRPQ